MVNYRSPQRYNNTIQVLVDPVSGSHTGDGSTLYPVATVALAMELIRQRRQSYQRQPNHQHHLECQRHQQAYVLLADGRHPLTEPLRLGPEDSGTTFMPATAAAQPVLDGSVLVDNWQEVQVNGAPVWQAQVPESVALSLIVEDTDGTLSRREPTRWPELGYAQIADQPGLDVTGDFIATLFQGSDTFTVNRDDFAQLPAIAPELVPELASELAPELGSGISPHTQSESLGAAIAVIPHYWVVERMPLIQADLSTGQFRSSLRSIFALRDDAKKEFAYYYLENVANMVGHQPGAWYLDGTSLFYTPQAGEQLPGFTARMPQVQHLVQVSANATNIRFEGVEFQYCAADYRRGYQAPFGVREDPLLDTTISYASDVQAASHVSAAIDFQGAQDCAVIDCKVSWVDGYAISMSHGSQGNTLSGNELTNLGAGGIKLGEAHYLGERGETGSYQISGSNVVADNVIKSGGRIYANCAAILATHADYTIIEHNEISDFFYTAISVGWVWGYGPSPTQHNLIRGNHIHTIGQGLLNDMGGIYLLGQAPGTIISGNVIHDVTCKNYGGWGIYLDEGSSHIVIENNLVFDVSNQCLHLHYGQENMVRKNVFAYGGDGLVAITRPEDRVSMTLLNNVLLTDGVPVFEGAYPHRSVADYQIISDVNLLWDSKNDGVWAADSHRYGPGDWRRKSDDSPQWHERGNDVNSSEANPGFTDLEARNFSLQPEAQAAKFLANFPPTAGPRPHDQRGKPATT